MDDYFEKKNQEKPWLRIGHPEKLAAIAEADKRLAIANGAGVAKSIKEIKDDLSKIPIMPEQCSMFSFLPRDMTRISPFFPMSRAEMGKRPYETQSYKNPWGAFEIQGERLSIFDESVLLAVLKLAKDQKQFTVETSYNELLAIIGSTKGKNTYKAVRDSLDRLLGVKVKIIINPPKKDRGRDDDKNIKKEISLKNTILSGIKEDTHKIRVTINDYFAAVYLDNMVTSIDMEFRARLAGDISRCLFRFYESQPADYEMSLEKLCAVINLPVTEKFRVRSQIKKALKDLTDKGFFVFAKISQKDNVITRRASLKVSQSADV